MDKTSIEARCKYFVDIALWPKKINFDPVGWMENFSEQEIPLAVRLLEGFTYYSGELTRQMFKSAFLTHSQNLILPNSTYIAAREEWSRYINSVTIVRVTGEDPNDSDSGFTFTRYARDFLQIKETQIMSHEKVLSNLVSRPEGHIVFVDDFVGSGNQFIETWTRKYRIGTSVMSFDNLSRNSRGRVSFTYCPVLCSELGQTNIQKHCPEVIISPAHFLSAKQSPLSTESHIWRDDMSSEGPEFIRLASKRAGIPDLDGEVGCWRGFHKLGLAVSFENTWPDSTLPFFYHDENGWKPLLKKGVP